MRCAYDRGRSFQSNTRPAGLDGLTVQQRGNRQRDGYTGNKSAKFGFHHGIFYKYSTTQKLNKPATTVQSGKRHEKSYDCVGGLPKQRPTTGSLSTPGGTLHDRLSPFGLFIRYVEGKSTSAPIVRFCM